MQTTDVQERLCRLIGAHVDERWHCKYVNDRQHLTKVHEQPHARMTNPINPAVVGALVREGREAAGLTQTQLAERIGASRFWVAAFEKGKPSVELGLALKAIQALGLVISIGPSHTRSVGTPSAHSLTDGITLDRVIAHATLTHAAPSKVVGWPGGSVTGRVPTPKPTRRTP
jgi:DNA-binding XRE family transcriptional regulator